MNIHLFRLLPYVRVDLFHQGKTLALDQVLIDTGSERSLFSSDEVSSIDIKPTPEDRVGRMTGIGGYEWVCWKRLDRIDLGRLEVLDGR